MLDVLLFIPAIDSRPPKSDLVSRKYLSHGHPVIFRRIPPNRIPPAAHRFLRRHWQRALQIRDRFHVSEETFHLLLAGGVGVLGGLVNLIFYFSIESVQRFIFNHEGDMVEVAETLAWWQRLAAPALGGLAAGLLLHWGFKLVGNRGPSNLLEAVAAGDGRLSLRSAVVKTISSVVSIGSGASIGREGGITQMTATMASRVGQLANWPPYRLRLLVACGAASGLSAAYNAPIAGAVFAAQVVLGNFSMRLFAPVVFSSVVASMVSRTFFGLEPWYEVPAFNFTHISQLPWFIWMGLLMGCLGAAFQLMLRRSTDFFRALSLPIHFKMALGGLLVGAIAIHYPGVWGNGYGMANRILLGNFTFQILIVLFCAKLVATMITVGSGAVGGVITPTLFLGAAMGSAFGVAVHLAGWGAGMPTSIFALVGMGSVLAATTRSPLFAMILVFEISLNYSLMPPLMLACVVSTLVASRFHADSIYTEPLRARGVQRDEDNLAPGEALDRRIGDLMNAPVPPLRETASFQEIVDRFLTSPNNFLPVVDAKRRLVGMVALQDMKEHLNDQQTVVPIIASDLMRPAPPTLTPNQRLIEALPALLQSELRNVPVVTSFAENRLIGSVNRSEVLALLSDTIVKAKS